jgi:hypothetical protein
VIALALSALAGVATTTAIACYLHYRALRPRRGRAWMLKGIVLPDPDDTRWDAAYGKSLLGKISVDHSDGEVTINGAWVGHLPKLGRLLGQNAEKRRLERLAAIAQREIEGP